MHRHVKRVLESLYGPTGSVIVHFVVIFLLLTFIQTTRQTVEPEVEVVIMEPDAVELEELELEPEPLEEPPEVVDTVAPPDVNLDMEQPPPVEEFNSSEPEMDFAALDVVSDVQSPLVMKGLFAGRSAGGRAAALGAYGGRWGQYTEAAVFKALVWLKRNQGADGSWGPNKPAMTGLGLLTFLAHGETPASEKFGPTVEKAIRFLVDAQDDSGRFTSTDNQPGPYAQSIATYGISEAYGVTRIPALKPAMEKAVQVLIDGQQPGGGWDYKYAKTARRDTSLGGWHVQALKAAYIAGAGNSGIKAAMDKAVEDLKGAHDPETGHFWYSDKGSHRTHSITGVAVLCLQLLGHGKSQQARDGLQALKDAGCDWKNPPSWAMYSWYYVTQAKFHQGGSTWSGWNDTFARVFVRTQNEDGSWTAPGGAAGVDHGAETNNGPVYSTTLAALTLQVYYRFLPTYKSEAVETHEEEEKPADDVEIEVI